MQFHEDIIFKQDSNKYSKEFLEIVKIKGKIVRTLRTEYAIIDPKIYKPDIVFELEDKVIIFEFQSTYVDVNDKRRFRLYSAIIDHEEIKSSKPIEVHVLSTIEGEKIKWYHVNPDSKFPIYIHSLKEHDSDEFLNNINTKIQHDKDMTIKELLMISLVCFMDGKENTESKILRSATTITNIPCLENNIGQFVKGVVLILCDKFVDDEMLNTHIANLVGGNMKIVEDYAQRMADKKVEEKNKEFIKNLNKEGFSLEKIAELTNVKIEFVEKTLTENQ